MKTLLLSLAILTSTLPAVAQAMGTDRVLSDLVRTGSIVHPQGILAGR